MGRTRMKRMRMRGRGEEGRESSLVFFPFFLRIDL